MLNIMSHLAEDIVNVGVVSPGQRDGGAELGVAEGEQETEHSHPGPHQEGGAHRTDLHNMQSLYTGVIHSAPSME